MKAKTTAFIKLARRLLSKIAGACETLGTVEAGYVSLKVVLEDIETDSLRLTRQKRAGRGLQAGGKID